LVSVTDESVHNAYISNSSITITQGNLEVLSRANVSITANAQAVSGGVVSGTGAKASIVFKPTVVASVTGNVNQATGDIKVNATVYIEKLNAVTNGAAVGAGVSIGASVATITVSHDIKAYIGAGTITTGGKVFVTALYNRGESDTDGGNISASAFAGAGALVGATGANADIEHKGAVRAYITGQTLNSDKGVFVNAFGYHNLTANGDGIGGGAAAIGSVVVSVNDNQSTYEAYINNSRTNITQSGNVEILSHITVNITVKAKATTGGIISGSSTDASISFKPVIRAYLAGNVEQANGDIKINATLFIKGLSAVSEGAAAGGVNIGDFIAKVTVSPDMASYIGTGTVNTNGSIYVEVYYNLDDNVSIFAGAYAGSGSLIGNATGAKAEIVHEGTFKAYITGQVIDSRKDIVVRALGYQKLNGYTGGLNIAGLVAKGAAVVSITNKPAFEAYVENSNITAAGSVLINAVRTGRIDAVAKGTNGGLVNAGVAKVLP